MDRKIGIYVHIPFCVRKCKYCDFLSFGYKDKEDKVKEYVEALKKEIWLYSFSYVNEKNKGIDGLNEDGESDNKYRVSSIYIGGGTPSVIKGEYIEDIIGCIRKFYDVDNDAEITIEVNPGTITDDKIVAYKKARINRVSIGLQSTNDEELKALGRIHSYEEFLKTYYLFRNNGFDNISVDLMSAIPNQTLESYKESLNKIIELKPEHISSYSLILEEGTPFYDMKDKLELASEDDERNMYYMTSEILRANGYNRYEISNYSLDGKESRHNSSYWDVSKHYLGLGLGASSYMVETKDGHKLEYRYEKTDDIDKYIYLLKNVDGFNLNNEKDSEKYDVKYNELEILQNKLECNKEVVTLEHKLEDYMYLGLRKMEGISISKFNEMSYMGKTIHDFYGDVLDYYRSHDLLEIKGDMIRLTDKGIDVSNTIFADFIDKVKF